MIAGDDVVDVVDSSRPEPDLGEVRGPHSLVGILALILRVVRRVDVIVDVSVSVIPLLIVILLEMMVGRVDGEVLAHPCLELYLFVDLVQ